MNQPDPAVSPNHREHLGSGHPASPEILGASFRDPSGFLFTHSGQLYRQVNQVYAQTYDQLMSSGLYAALVKAGRLIAHTEVIPPDAVPSPAPEQSYKLIHPERVGFISYPYEWSFSQLKDAALLTLQIQKQALEFGMSLKDSSAYNIQFQHGRPVLIDTLSLEAYVEGRPWVAYRQFCQHFLAPLALMACRDVRLNQLARVYIDGIPLDLASRLLPWRTRLSFPLLLHLHLHAASQQRYADRPVETVRQVSRVSLLGLIDSLEGCVRRLEWKPGGTAWGDYYQAGQSASHNYTPAGLQHKQALVSAYLAAIQPEQVWDLGANTGLFSRLAAHQKIPTLAFDIDPTAVEQNYRQCVQEKERFLLPLLLDLTNPSPAIGWGLAERLSLAERAPASRQRCAILALALVHHLAIANNTPLERVAAYLGQFGDWLIIEFVPKSDSQVQRLLAAREDIFSGYTAENFERIFSQVYQMLRCEQIADSERRLYLMKKLASSQ